MQWISLTKKEKEDHARMHVAKNYGGCFPDTQSEEMAISCFMDAMEISATAPPALPENNLTALKNEPVSFLLSNALRHLTQEQQLQLCNALRERLPAPASAVEEAAKMYPEQKGMILSNQTARLQQKAHITCAGMYTDQIEDLKDEIASKETIAEGLSHELETLKAENSKMRGALDRLTDENNKLAGENHMQSEELGEMKNITDGLPARIINQQRDLLIAYRNKIALTPGATIETILAMLEDDIKTLRAMDGGEIIKNIKK